MKKDIKNMEDVKKLVDAFYERLLKDERISYFFEDVRWEEHLPVMYAFWENMLFFTGSYTGNPMTSHKKIHEKMKFEVNHFDVWLSHFKAAVNEHFEGEKAELARQRAESISTIMKIKIVYQ